eukprot:TRINITY_DN115_c0_g1_i1.p1 TRINITY_DN115_c0_g1~~TRINITY_DN115_c0_g1_i1.p1  ORF type:complete len:91 (+),score=19.32 TRINITY_DN115_c0_g1_i1:43-315(+)
MGKGQSSQYKGGKNQKIQRDLSDRRHKEIRKNEVEERSKATRKIETPKFQKNFIGKIFIFTITAIVAFLVFVYLFGDIQKMFESTDKIDL